MKIKGVISSIHEVDVPEEEIIKAAMKLPKKEIGKLLLESTLAALRKNAQLSEDSYIEENCWYNYSFFDRHKSEDVYCRVRNLTSKEVLIYHNALQLIEFIGD